MNHNIPYFQTLYSLCPLRDRRALLNFTVTGGNFKLWCNLGSYISIHSIFSIFTKNWSYRARLIEFYVNFFIKIAIDVTILLSYKNGVLNVYTIPLKSLFNVIFVQYYHKLFLIIKTHPYFSMLKLHPFHFCWTNKGLMMFVEYYNVGIN